MRAETRAKSTKESSIADLVDFFCNSALWTSLNHAETQLFTELECFGWNQPAVRKSAWATLQCLLQHWKGGLPFRLLKLFPLLSRSRIGSMERMLPTLSITVLRSAWVEPDAAVRSVMWQPLLTFLKGRDRSVMFLARIDRSVNRISPSLEFGWH